MNSQLRRTHRNRSQSLSRRRLMAGVEQLEARALLATLAGTEIPDAPHIGTYPVWHGTPRNPTGPTPAPPFPLSDTFLLNSRPGATKTIYLDFDGHITTNTLWNTLFNTPAIVTPTFDFDGNSNAFNDAELERIQRIWQRTAEDFAPFDVNVTTQFISEDVLNRTGAGDVQWGMRAAIGGTFNIIPGLGGAGGVAFLGSFGNANMAPAFVFSETQGNDEHVVTETISHEIGHTLGLDHDGTTTLGYYPGHGTGPTSWGPIMGAGFNVELTQWSMNTYPGADNPEDDLAIITGGANGFGYRPDDYGSSLGGATPIQISSAGNGFISGVIEQNTDEDWVQVILPDGAATFTAVGAERGSNLDILLEVYDSNGVQVAVDNPIDELGASITATLRGGTYYVKLSGTGRAPTAGHPGYPKYGSLGQYTLGFNVIPSSHIQGVVYLDLAADGARQATDPAGAGFTVFIDDNLDGVLNVGESSTVTDANGFYDLLTVPGRRNVRVQTGPGYVVTDPRLGYATVDVAANGQVVGGVLLGVWGAPGEVRGHKWMDYNSNASLNPEHGDGPLGGIFIFVDINNDGRPGMGEPAAVTANDGSYIIKNVPIGTYALREVLTPGTATAFPSTNNGTHLITMTPGAVLGGLDFFNSPAHDYGDAPESYQTTLAGGGPVHGYQAGYHLGATVDADANGNPTPWAMGDDNVFSDDEDGVRFLNIPNPGGVANIEVTVNVPAFTPNGFLHAWMDFNADGDFSDAGEKILQGIRLGTGKYSFQVQVPASAPVGPTFARFRYGPESTMGPGGRSQAGEVEDYRLNVFLNTPTAVDDGDAPPLDPQTADIAVTQLSVDNRINVLANDIRSSRGPIHIVAAPFAGTGKTTDLGGTVTIDDNGTPTNLADDVLLYDAAPAPAGSNGQKFYVDHFTYTISDGFTTDTADVWITVNKISTAPTAVEDTFNARPNTASSNNTAIMNVTANDIGGMVQGVATNRKVLVSFDSQVFNADGQLIGTVTRDQRGTWFDKTDDRLIFKAAPGVNNTTGQFTYTINNPQDLDPSLRQTATVTVQVRDRIMQPDATDEVALSIGVFTNTAGGNPGTRVDIGTGPFNIVENGEYWVGVFARDLRGPLVTAGGDEANGVQGVFFDMLYDAKFVEPVKAPISSTNPLGLEFRVQNPYEIATSTETSVSTPGLISELGGIALSAAGDGNQDVIYIKFKVKDLPNSQLPTTGNPFWRLDPADFRSDVDPSFGNDIIVNDENDVTTIRNVLIENVAYLPSHNFKIQAAASPTLASSSIASSPIAPVSPTQPKSTSTSTSTTTTTSSSGGASQAELLAYYNSLAQNNATATSSRTVSVSTKATDAAITSLFDDLLAGKKK